MLRWLLVIMASAYMLGALGFCANYYFGNADQGLFHALQEGFAWPGLLVELVRSSGL